MPASGPRSRGARVHPRSCQGCQPWPRASGLVLATEKLGGITGRRTSDPDSGHLRQPPPRLAQHEPVARRGRGRRPGRRVRVYKGLKEIPPYDEDDDVHPRPESVARLNEAIAKADAVFFATPEYNSSIPGQLKN